MNNNVHIDYDLINKKLNSNKFDNIDFMGIVSYMIYSTQIFPKNNDISIFLNKIFGISYLDYVIKARPLIVSRVTKHILSLNNKELLKAKDDIVKFISTNNVQADKKSNKKRNANDKLEVWLKGL